MKRKAVKCPKCESMNTISIIYGMPTEEAFKESDKGLVKLGGCCMEIGAPEQYCKDCTNEW